MKSCIKKFSGIIYILSLVLCFVSCKPDVVVSDITAPGCVTNVNAESEEGKIVLTWTDPADSDLLGIKIYNAEEKGAARSVSFADGILVGKGIQKYEITGLEDNKTYTFKITAVDNSLNESSSVETEKVTFKEKTITEYVDKTYAAPVVFTSESAGNGKLLVTLATATENAIIYYTTDGTAPTLESSVYTDKITFTEDAVIKAMAVKEGIENSPVSVATVNIVEKTVEVEKLVYTTAVKAGTYTIYHFQQKTSGGKAFADYTLNTTENSKTVAENSTLDNLKKTYAGFTAKALAQNETAIYVFYDRNTITYTFQTGTEGKFEDGKIEKTVSGLYGTSYTKPKAPTSGDYNFVKWQDASENVAPSTFGAEDKIWTAVWKEKSAGGAPDYSTCVVGDFILKDGTVLSKDETPESGTVAAVIVRAAADGKPALGVGIVHNRSGLAWCTSSAAGYSTNITDLQGDRTSDYMDGSDGWEILKAACSDADAHPGDYPAWQYCLEYASKNNLTGELANGWYLPTVAELYTIYQNKTVVDASLSKAGGSQFGTSWYWSCCQSPSHFRDAWTLNFSIGYMDFNAKYGSGNYVCSVRAFD